MSAGVGRRAALLRRIDRVRGRLGGKLRRTVARAYAAVRPDPAAASGQFLGVLDGSTLNLAATLPGRGNRPATAEVCFRHGERSVSAPASIRGDDVAGFTVTAVVPLGDGSGTPGAVALSGGSWRLGLRITDDKGSRTSVAISGAELAIPPTPRCPRTGRLFSPGVDERGRCRLKVSKPKAVAEVTRVAMVPGRPEICGRMVGVPAGTGAEVEFVARSEGTRWAAPVTVDGTSFRLVVPLASLGRGAIGVEQIWDAWLLTDGGARLRLGRWLGQVDDPRAVFRLNRQVHPAGPLLVAYRPHYTPAGSLAFAVLPFPRSTETPS